MSRGSDREDCADAVAVSDKTLPFKDSKSGAVEYISVSLVMSGIVKGRLMLLETSVS